jgi:hypothetical protein
VGKIQLIARIQLNGRGDFDMLKNHHKTSMKRFLASVLILLIGLNIVNSQSPPPIFKIENMTASPDKGEYLRNDMIRIEYNLYCSGNTGEKSFVFKANKSFDLNTLPKYKPNIIYPSGIGNQSKKPYFYSTPEGFKRYFVPLFDNNSKSKRYITKITINISPTSECKLNRTFDLTDRSFVEISPGGKRIQSPIRIVNKNPEIINSIINETKMTAQFTFKDEDSHLVDWYLFKNGRNIPGYNGSINMKEDPIDENTINISPFYPELDSMRLRLLDSDGGEKWSSSLNNWKIKNNRISPAETIYLKFSIFILVVIVLSFLSFNYFPLELRGKLILYAIVILVLHYEIFKYDFELLISILIISSSLSNYFVYILSKRNITNNNDKFVWDEIPGKGNERLVEFLTRITGIKFRKNAKIEKFDNGATIKVSTDKNIISPKLDNKKTEVVMEVDNKQTNKFIAKMENDWLNIYDNKDFLKKWSLIFSSWMALIMLIIINISSRDTIKINYIFCSAALMGFPAFVIPTAAKLKDYAKGFELPVIFYCLIWVVILIFNIIGVTINSFGNIYIENLLIVSYLTFFSLNLLPALVYLYQSPDQRPNI